MKIITTENKNLIKHYQKQRDEGASKFEKEFEK